MDSLPEEILTFYKINELDFCWFTDKHFVLMTSSPDICIKSALHWQHIDAMCYNYSKDWPHLTSCQELEIHWIGTDLKENTWLKTLQLFRIVNSLPGKKLFVNYFNSNFGFLLSFKRKLNFKWQTEARCILNRFV